MKAAHAIAAIGKSLAHSFKIGMSFPPPLPREIVHTYSEYEHVRVQSMAAGMQHEFETAFWYLQEHSKTTPEPAPSARSVLQTLLEFHT